MSLPAPEAEHVDQLAGVLEDREFVPPLLSGIGNNGGQGKSRLVGVEHPALPPSLQLFKDLQVGLGFPELLRVGMTVEALS